MAHRKITADEFTCERCGHVRVLAASDVLPGRCAKCKSPYWNSPRKLASGPKRKKGISIRPKPTAPPAPKPRVPKKPDEKPAAQPPPEPTAAHREVSRHCKAEAHAGCKAPNCGCPCHK